jgi:uncharacterized protein YecE (DUF72 family)
LQLRAINLKRNAREWRNFFAEKFFFLVKIVYFCTLKLKNMKEIIRELAQGFKEDPKEALYSVAFVIGWGFLTWAGLWFAAIVEGRV